GWGSRGHNKTSVLALRLSETVWARHPLVSARIRLLPSCTRVPGHFSRDFWLHSTSPPFQRSRNVTVRARQPDTPSETPKPQNGSPSSSCQTPPHLRAGSSTVGW